MAPSAWGIGIDHRRLGYNNWDSMYMQIHKNVIKSHSAYKRPFHNIISLNIAKT